VLTQRLAPDPLPTVQSLFLAILPRIERHGQVHFRDLRCHDRRQEAVALCWLWFVRLARRGKDATRFPAALAAFAARAVRAGRLCRQERSGDALSPRARRRHGCAARSLPVHGIRPGSALEDASADNTQSPPDEQAAFRIDFPAWLTTLTDRDRRLVADLMVGERTRDVAGKYGLSPARVSQLRREFQADWSRFCGERPGRRRLTAPTASAGKARRPVS